MRRRWPNKDTQTRITVSLDRDTHAGLLSIAGLEQRSLDWLGGEAVRLFVGDYLSKSAVARSESAMSPQPAEDTLTTLDLFCGAGGIAEGFRQAGYRCLFGNDFNADAIRTFKHNHPSAEACPGSITTLDPDSIRKRLGLKAGDLDVLAGGPPCQGFSINAPDRFLTDDRNQLFRDYIRFVDSFQPKCLMFENVPGMLSLAKGKIFEAVKAELVKRGYHVTAKILLAAHYGVPQERFRMIILGSKAAPIQHPQPTHFWQARTNFTAGRTMTIQLTAESAGSLRRAVTVSEAIGDLPSLKMGEGQERMEYGQWKNLGEYAKSVRNPAGYTFNHRVAVLSSTNIARLRHIPAGGSWRDIPHALLPLGMKRARRSDHTKRYGRLSANGLSGTVMTKCDPHWGAWFHYDQDRSLTVREAARIQSFPDTYEFLGPRTAQYEQVGNAVPVLMARAVAGAIAKHLASHHQRVVATMPLSL
jgi:DNA (cytosine-5)-methyltransferase 1